MSSSVREQTNRSFSLGNGKRRRPCLAVTVSSLALLAASPAMAQTDTTWIGPAGGAWTDGDNWDPTGTPVISSRVIINNSRAVLSATDVQQINGFRLGYEGEGRLDINSGAVLETGSNSHIGGGDFDGASGTGILDVTGIMRSGRLGTNLSIGYGWGSIGRAYVREGGHLEQDSIDVGVFGEGSLEIEGADSTLSSEVLRVGYFRDGLLRITDGRATSSTTIIGAEPGRDGTIEISGGIFEAGQTTIGSRGAGAISVSNGGHLTSSIASIGFFQNSIGDVRVESGSSWVNAFIIEIGNSIQAGNSGHGTLSVSGGGEVETAHIHIGNSGDEEGKVTVTGPHSELKAIGLPSGELGEVSVGYQGNGALTVSNGGTIRSGTGIIGRLNGSNGSVTITGPGSQWINDSSLRVGLQGGAELRIENGGYVRSGTGTIGPLFGYGGLGEATVTGSDSHWEMTTGSSESGLRIGYDSQGALTLSDGGKVTTNQVILGEVTHFGMDRGIGTLNIGAASGGTAAGAGILEAPGGLIFGNDTGTVVFNHTDGDYSFGLDIARSGTGNLGNITIRHQHGTTTYTGDGSAFTGTTYITGGTLNVTDSLGGSVYVGPGTLGGIARVGDVRVANGGILAPGIDGIGTLTMEYLSLGGSAQLHYDLGAPGTAGSPGASDMIVVEGDLVLNGQLHLFDGGGAGIGHYRLMTYGGDLTGSGLDIATADIEGAIQTGGGNVDLVISSGAFGPGPDPDPGPGPIIGDPNLQYWQDNSTPWTAADQDWRNDGGDIDVAWAGNHGVFNGSGGTVEVEGSQSFHGLQFVSNGYVLSGAGTLQTVSVGSELRVLADETATIGAEIAGSGGIDKTQGGTLILVGVNSYTGATSIGAGTLALQGTGDISTSEALTFTGAGLFDVSGVAAPTAQIGTLSGVAGSGIVLGATDLEVVQVAAGTWGGTITGAGDVALTGAGVLTLAGTASHTGLTSIAGGATLQVGDGGTSGSVTGNILNHGTLIFERSDDFTYDGVLSGTGGFYQLGSGTATLTGNSSAYGGDVGIDDGGTLRLASGAVLGTSGLSIDPGSTLAGMGRVIGDVTSYGGIIAPGMDALGTLTVEGNVLFHTDSILAVRIASNGDNDTLDVNGEASLAGNVEVTAIDMAANYVDGQTYTILTATDPLDGAFVDAVMANHSAFLTPSLAHNANDVLLTIAVTADFTTVAETYNQLQTSSALNGLEQSGDAQEVFNEIAMLNPDQARRAFDVTSGEIHASGQYVIDQTFGLFSRTLRHQAGAGMGVAGVAAIDDATTSAYADRRIAQAWLAPLGGRGTSDGDGNAATLDWWSAGIAGGYEGQIDLGAGNGFAGFGLAYIHSHGSVDARLSSFDADGFHVGAYGAWEDGTWRLAGALAYAANHISIERRIAFGGIDRTTEADYWTHSLGFSGETAYGVDMGNGTALLPLFTLDAGWSSHGRFTETGAGALNLTGASESWTRLDTGIGLGVSHMLPTETGRLVMEGRAVWEHAFTDVVSSQQLNMAGSSAGFDVRSPAAGRDRLRFGAGLAWDVASDMTIRANYDGLFLGDQSSHSGSIGLNIRF